jgi:hypothetical protein
VAYIYRLDWAQDREFATNRSHGPSERKDKSALPSTLVYVYNGRLYAARYEPTCGRCTDAVGSDSGQRRDSTQPTTWSTFGLRTIQQVTWAP